MRITAQLTGLSPYVIRVWEKRYQAINPIRTDSNHRTYTNEHIERLRLLKEATDLGFRIGSIAKLEDEDLKKKIDAREEINLSEGSNENDPKQLIEKAMQSILDMDEKGLNSLLQRSCFEFSQKTVLIQFISPLIRLIGKKWEQEELTIGQEHVATEVIKVFLKGMIRSSSDETLPKIAIGAPSGHRHELGALIAAVAASQNGWNTIYFGVDVPVDSIAEIAERKKVQAIGLSIVLDVESKELLQDLSKLKGNLPSSVRVYVGGYGARRLQEDLNSMHMNYVRDMDQFEDELDRFRS